MIMDSDRKRELFLSLVKREASVEEVLTQIALEGLTPNLIFDEKEKTWAIVQKGVAVTKPVEDFYDIGIYLYGRKEGFKPDIQSAILHYLWPADYYEDDDIVVKQDKTFFFKPKLNDL